MSVLINHHKNGPVIGSFPYFKDACAVHWKRKRFCKNGLQTKKTTDIVITLNRMTNTCPYPKYHNLIT